MTITLEDLDRVDAEYGKDSEPCPFCGGMTDRDLGHIPIKRRDGAYTRCQVGDVRALAKALRIAQEEWNASLDKIANSLPTECRHGRPIHGTCDVCDSTDPLNLALEEAEHFIGKISVGHVPTKEEVEELIARIRGFRDGELLG